MMAVSAYDPHGEFKHKHKHLLSPDRDLRWELATLVQLRRCALSPQNKQIHKKKPNTILDIDQVIAKRDTTNP